MYQLAMEMVSQEFRISLYVLCKGNKCAVIGRICMDQLFIDDEVIILGEGIDIDTLSENVIIYPIRHPQLLKGVLLKKR